MDKNKVKRQARRKFIPDPKRSAPGWKSLTKDVVAEHGHLPKCEIRCLEFKGCDYPQHKTKCLGSFLCRDYKNKKGDYPDVKRIAKLEGVLSAS